MARRKNKESEAEFKVPEMPKKEEEIIEIKEEAKVEPEEEQKPEPEQKKKFMLPKDPAEQIAENLKVPKKEDFAAAEQILILEIEEDGRARYLPARWTGKSDVMTDETTQKIYKLTTSGNEPPPFFQIPHQVATNPISLLFLSLSRFFGMKTVWHRALLFLPNNNKPFDWKKQKQDLFSGKEWNATVDMSAMSVASTVFQRQSTSSMILYILIGFVVILCFAILATLIGG